MFVFTSVLAFRDQVFAFSVLPTTPNRTVRRAITSFEILFPAPAESHLPLRCYAVRSAAVIAYTYFICTRKKGNLFSRFCGSRAIQPPAYTVWSGDGPRGPFSIASRTFGPLDFDIPCQPTASADILIPFRFLFSAPQFACRKHINKKKNR